MTPHQAPLMVMKMERKEIKETSTVLAVFLVLICVNIVGFLIFIFFFWYMRRDQEAQKEPLHVNQRCRPKVSEEPGIC